jgi:hypothetical protein
MGCVGHVALHVGSLFKAHTLSQAGRTLSRRTRCCYLLSWRCPASLHLQAQMVVKRTALDGGGRARCVPAVTAIEQLSRLTAISHALCSWHGQ